MYVQMQVNHHFKLSNSSVIYYSSGSNVIVAGTAIFGASDPEGVIAQLKSTVNYALAKITAK